MTTTKKEITDFLWEWAKAQGLWAEMLTDAVIKTSESLEELKRQEIFEYFLQSIGVYHGLPVLKLTQPTYKPPSDKIVLVSLSAIEGVTRLAKNQTLNFSPNLTVIYGENGTGKTSYGRIIKSLGFSYDNNNTVIGNIFGNINTRKKAVLKYKYNNEDKEFEWNGQDKQEDLANISVFNENCVKISFSDRQLLVSPMGFHLFNLVSSELDELMELLNKKIQSLPNKVSWVSKLNPGTEQYLFLSGLSASSSKEYLQKIGNYTEAHHKEKEEQEANLSKLNNLFLQGEVNRLALQVRELDLLLNKLQNIESKISIEKFEQIKKLVEDVTALENKKQVSIQEIANAKDVKFFESEAFKQFLLSAETYIRLLDNEEYPTAGDVCIFCQQKLDVSGEELVIAYRKILNDNTQNKIQEIRSQINILISQLSSLDVSIIFNQPTFGLDADGNALQPAEINDLCIKLSKTKEYINNGQFESWLVTDIDYKSSIQFLENKRLEIENTLQKNRESLINLEVQENAIKKNLASLNDRKVINDSISEIIEIINNCKIIDLLESCRNSFNTSSISRKTTQAREELVKHNFTHIFENELKLFRKSNIKIDFDFSTTKGSSKIFQRINAHQLSDILSEGEQKVIALAAFLTELQLDSNNKSPIIFDDPVNSLDHKIIDEAVKRFIKLSKDRQVIVFTHNILMLNSFLQQSELHPNKNCMTFNSVKTNFDETGIIGEIDDLHSYNDYIKKLKAVINANPQGQDESKLAAEGYGHLRSAIEVTVEEGILKNTVKRYRKGVAFPSLLRIDGQKLDEVKTNLNDIYEKCCVSIDGHSSPSEIHNTPTISELQMDFNTLTEIRKQFT